MGPDLGISIERESAARSPWRWHPSVTALVLGEPQLSVVRGAIVFWNKVFRHVGASMQIGLLRAGPCLIQNDDLEVVSRAIAVDGVAASPPGFDALEGDIVIAFASKESKPMVSFATNPYASGRVLIGIRPDRDQRITKNLVAHELGHAMGLSHNDDPTKLMCRSPMSAWSRAELARVAAFGRTGCLPLTTEEREQLRSLYPSTLFKRGETS